MSFVDIGIVVTTILILLIIWWSAHIPEVRMSQAVHTEDKKVACACRIDPDTPRLVSAYTLPADPACPRCHGTGWRTRRTTYDRQPERFAKILSEEWT